MAEASPDLSTYEFHSCLPLPSLSEATNEGMRKGLCQPKEEKFPVDKHSSRFLSVWYEKFD